MSEMNQNDWDEIVESLKAAVSSDGDLMADFSLFSESLLVAEIEISIGDEHIKTIDIKNDLLKGGITSVSFIDEARGINLTMGVMETIIMESLQDTEIFKQNITDRFDTFGGHTTEYYLNETMTASLRFEAHLTKHTILMTLMGALLLISISRSLYKSWGEGGSNKKSFLAVKRLKDYITLILGFISSVFRLIIYLPGDGSSFISVLTIYCIARQMLFCLCMILKFFSAEIYTYQLIMVVRPFYFRNNKGLLTRILLSSMIATIVLMVVPFIIVLIITAYTSDCSSLDQLFRATRVMEFIVCGASLGLSTVITMVYVIVYYFIKISRPDRGSDASDDDKETVVNSLKAAVETITNLFTIVLIYKSTAGSMEVSSQTRAELSVSFGSCNVVSSFLFNQVSVPLQYNFMSAQFAINEFIGIIGKCLNRAYIYVMSRWKGNADAVEVDLELNKK